MCIFSLLIHTDAISDIDECADASLNTCGENTKCENSPGSFDCTCAPGFESTDSDKTNGKDITCEGESPINLI